MHKHCQPRSQQVTVSIPSTTTSYSRHLKSVLNKLRIRPCSPQKVMHPTSLPILYPLSPFCRSFSALTSTSLHCEQARPSVAQPPTVWGRRVGEGRLVHRCTLRRRLHLLKALRSLRSQPTWWLPRAPPCNPHRAVPVESTILLATPTRLPTKQPATAPCCTHCGR